MVRMRYLGINDPDAVFERFRPMRQELFDLRLRRLPFRADCNALAAAITGLDTAAIHFTKNPHFYVPKWVQPSYGSVRTDEEYPRD